MNARHTSPGAVSPSAWWLVLCLIGLDYFSTLAYLPSLAVEAAGPLAPFAALLVVAVTLLAALPVYLYVVGRSPHGRGGTGVIERLIPGWAGKLLVLLLLAFVATDYVVTQNLGGWKTPGVTTKLILWNPLICVALLGRWWNHGFELAKEQPWTAMTRGLLS